MSPELRPEVGSDVRVALQAGRFALWSDLQRTHLIEKFVLFRESNDAARERVGRELSGIELDFVALLGDLVVQNTRAEWEVFDRLTERLRARGTPLHALLGNHDYWGPRAPLFARFPALGEHEWFALAYGPLRIAALNTNRRWLRGSEREAQTLWFEDRLRVWDADADVRGVLVLGHHPPFTNGMMDGDTRWLHERAVKSFLGARKTLSWFSGHVQTYERFEKEGRTFVVCGGGGGPRARLLAGPRRRHADLYRGPEPRPFHFVAVSLTRDGLELEVPSVADGDAPLIIADRFTLPFRG